MEAEIIFVPASEGTLMADFAFFLPLVGVVLFFAIEFVWRAWLEYRRHGDAG